MTQWLSARKSVDDFRRLGYHQWTTKHAFLADMGGFRLKTLGAESIPINSKSLLYLIQEGFISEQQVKALIMLDTNVIEDRNKADSFARVIALVQTCWFACSIVGRYAQGLAITTLELTVIGFLAPTIATYFCWWHKPRDVMTVQTIQINASLESILGCAGLAVSTEWHYSPFDFVERSEFHGSLLFRYWINILKRIAYPRPTSGLNCVKVHQRRSDNDICALESHWKYGWIEVVPTIPYLAINFTAWNFHFPTPIELWMWRASSIAMAATFLIGAAIEVFFLQLWPTDSEKLVLQKHRHEADLLRTLKRDHLRRWTRFAYEFKLVCQGLRNNSASDDPSLDVPLRLLIPATIFAAVYSIGRLYILAEDIASFRSMPRSTFETVNWTIFVPHLS